MKIYEIQYTTHPFSSTVEWKFVESYDDNTRAVKRAERLKECYPQNEYRVVVLDLIYDSKEIKK